MQPSVTAPLSSEKQPSSMIFPSLLGRATSIIGCFCCCHSYFVSFFAETLDTLLIRINTIFEPLISLTALFKEKTALSRVPDIL